MLKQVALLPSGCQICSQSLVLYIDEERIIYCSSLAIYILNTVNYSVDKILSLNHRAITSLSICPFDKNLLVVSGKDGNVCLWNIEEEEIISKVTMNNYSVTVAWNPSNKNQIAILHENSLRFYLWDIDKSSNNASETFCVRNESIKPILMRFNDKIAGLVAIGCNGGATFLYRINDKSHKILQGSDSKVSVVDLQWDRLSSNYLLIAYQTFITLWDAESGEQVHSFDKQPLPITGIAWMDWTAGNFVSMNSKNSHLKVWNASQKHPLDSIRLQGEGGIVSLRFHTSKKLALYFNFDGSVGLFNLNTMKKEFRTEPGHTETIFGCKFHPVTPHIFATASYDKTVKLWNTNNMTLRKTLYGADDIIYNIDWSPSGKLIAACCGNGSIVIWDAESGRELTKHLNHTKTAYFVAWNPLNERYLLTSSADCSIVVIDVDPYSLRANAATNIPTGSRRKSTTTNGVLNKANSNICISNIVYRFVHPTAVFGVAWCPHRVSVFSTCAQDGLVRIFNYALQTPLAFVLTGHTARAFSCVWSPLVEGLLATGSDDYTVNVWKVDLSQVTNHDAQQTSKVLVDFSSSQTIDLSNTSEPSNYVPPVAVASLRETFPVFPNPRPVYPTKTLPGHRGFVRALSFNYEQKDILLSGSWDFSIRIWNVSSGTCLWEIHEHVSDVYALTSHPLRPFTYLSASRDTTVRMWQLGGSFDLMKYRAVFDRSMRRMISSDQVLDNIDQKYTGETYEPINEFSHPSLQLVRRLFGRESKALQDDRFHVDHESGIETRSSNKTQDNYSSPGKSHLLDAINDYNLVSIEIAFHYYSLLALLAGGTGVLDLFENVILSLLNKGAKNKDKGSTYYTQQIRQNYQRTIFHQTEVIPIAQGEAMKAVQVSTNKMNLVSKKTADIEEQLNSAAMVYARLGDFKQYCSIMISLDRWPEALAMAPAVSMEYWQQLCQTFALLSAQKCNETCIPAFLAIGKDGDAIDYYLRNRDDINALLVGKTSQQRNDVIPSYQLSLAVGDDGSDGNAVPIKSVEELEFEAMKSSTKITHAPLLKQLSTPAKLVQTLSLGHIDLNMSMQFFSNAENLSTVLNTNSNANISSTSQRHRTDRELEEATGVVKRVAACTANFYEQTLSQPILAAAQYIAVDDINNAVECLIRAREFDLAHAVAVCYYTHAKEVNNVTDMGTYGSYIKDISLAWADRCSVMGDIDLAIDILYTSNKCNPNSNGSIDIELEEDIALVLSKHSNFNASKVGMIITNRGLKSEQYWSSRGNEEEAIGSDAAAIASFVVTKQYKKAAIIVLNTVKRIARGLMGINRATNNNNNGGLDLTSQQRRVLRAASFINAEELDEPILSHFLAAMHFIAAHQAALKYHDFSTASYILGALLSHIKDHDIVNLLSLSEDELRAEMLAWQILSGQLNDALHTVDELLIIVTHSDNHNLNDKMYAAKDIFSALSKALRETTVYDWQELKRKKQMQLNSIIVNNTSPTHRALRQLNRLMEFFALPMPQRPNDPLLNHYMGEAASILELELLVAANKGTVLLGSLLPVANRKMKHYSSAVSQRRIQGSPMRLSLHNQQVSENHSVEQEAASKLLRGNGSTRSGSSTTGSFDCYASRNEIAAWTRFLPYSPLWNGEYIFYL